MKIKLIDYKGKFDIWQDQSYNLGDGWDLERGVIDSDSLTDSDIEEQHELSRYYGVPAYMGDDKRINDKIEELDKLYNKR